MLGRAPASTRRARGVDPDQRLGLELAEAGIGGGDQEAVVSRALMLPVVPCT